MAQKITREEVEKIAQLARLELSEEEIETYTGQLSVILGYIDQLKEVNTQNVPITSQVTGLSNVLRDDEVDACDDPAGLIKLAPESKDNLVTVKAVFE